MNRLVREVYTVVDWKRHLSEDPNICRSKCFAQDYEPLRYDPV